MVQSPQYLVDTSIFIAHIRQQKQQPTLFQQALATYGKPSASLVSLFELEVGARRRNQKHEFHQFFGFVSLYPLTEAILIEAAILQADLLSRNQLIGVLDVFIAATALHQGLPLLILNAKHFQRIANLKLLALP